MTADPILSLPGETCPLKIAAHRAGKNERTIRRWCKQYGIGMQPSPGAPIEVNTIALEMVMHGDTDALELLRDGQRSHPRVIRYLKCPDMSGHAAYRESATRALLGASNGAGSMTVNGNAAVWPGPENCPTLETANEIRCGREDCGAAAYVIEGSKRPVIIECGKALVRGQGGKCTYRCPNTVVRGDDLATVEAEWLSAFVEPSVPDNGGNNA